MARLSARVTSKRRYNSSRRRQDAGYRRTSVTVSFEAFSDQSLGRRLRSISRFAHTGEVLGLPGQTIAGLATAGAVVLVWTGVALTLRRFRAWVARRGKRQTEVVAARDASAA